jgi:Ca-activated chloride channel family protein
MTPRRSRPAAVAAALLLALAACSFFSHASAQDQTAEAFEASGSLRATGADGQTRGFCPLKHTSVRAEIAGFLSRVTVTQEFENNFPEKIEAVYVFPLPQDAAVDDMTLRVGERVVRGKILRREEAQAVYEEARAGGRTAALLDQERPNVFTQSVANVAPGERVTVTLSYVETLRYEDGAYEFVFPTVVGPRYVPGQVPDAARVSPPVAPKGTRAGHDISIEVSLDAGLPVEELKSSTHEIEVERRGPASARVRLRKLTAIPNRDFVLRYDVAGGRIGDAVLAHSAGRGGFFALVLQPPERFALTDVTPRELVFVLDTSGSMRGFPIEKAKEAMGHALAGLNPYDTFNLITFSGDTHVLFPRPVHATPENLAKARAFLESREGGGGTEMMKAIRAALAPTDSQSHVRVVCFMTDGFVGNDFEIIKEVRRHPNARVFAFGVGGSVNRFLLDRMAEHGRGEVEYVSLRDDGSAAARRFHERVRSPLLTDIHVDWGGLPVADVYPQRLPDLFAAKPLVVVGRYKGAGRGTLRLRGRTPAGDFVREIEVNLPAAEPAREVLGTLWARRRVEDLMAQDFEGAQKGTVRADLRAQIVNLGLEYRLMTQYTSFVAVEEVVVREGGVTRRVEVPVELPSGVSDAAVGNELHSLHFIGGMSVGITNTAPLNRNFGYILTAPPTTATPPAKAKPAAAAPTELEADAVVRVESKLTPEQEKQRALDAKLHPSVAALVERLRRKGSQPSAEEPKFVKGGKAEVRVRLKEKTPEVLAKLKELGFEVILDPTTAKLVVGRIVVEKLEALAALDAVRSVSPR